MAAILQNINISKNTNIKHSINRNINITADICIIIKANTNSNIYILYVYDICIYLHILIYSLKSQIGRHPHFPFSDL